jgi:hypothetical protein
VKTEVKKDDVNLFANAQALYDPGMAKKEVL